MTTAVVARADVARGEGRSVPLSSRRSGHVAAKTRTSALRLLFLYKEVLCEPLGDIEDCAPNSRSTRHRPSRDQIRVFRAPLSTATTPCPLLVDLLYGCGLRVSEPWNCA